MGRALRTNGLPTSNGADVSDAIAPETLRNLNFWEQTVALDRPWRGVEDPRGDPPLHDCVVRQLVELLDNQIDVAAFHETLRVLDCESHSEQARDARNSLPKLAPEF